MSLEERLAENTAAMKELTAELKATNQSRAAAVDAAKELAAGGSTAKPRAGRPPKDAAAAPAETAKPAEQPATDAPSAAANPPPGLPASPTELRVAAQTYMSGAKDDAEKARRKNFLQSVITHFGAGGDGSFVGSVPMENISQVIRWLDQSAAGQRVDFNEDQDLPAKPEDDDFDLG